MKAAQPTHKFLIGTTTSLAMVLAGAITAGSAWAQDPANVEITATDLGSGLYMLVGQGGNIGVSVGDDGVFVIDDQFAPLSEKILAAIGDLSDGPVRYVLNTHFHGDHTGGNENMSGAGATIVAHTNVRTRMSSDQVTFFGPSPAAPADALPDVTYTDGAAFHINGHDIQAIHVANAHTDGDTVIHIAEANVIHAGDVFFNGLFPFVDSLNGGSVDGMIAALDLIASLADAETQIVPGHGALGNKADVENARDDLIKLRDGIRPLIAQGLSVDEIVGQSPLGGLDLHTTTGFFDEDTFVRVMVDGLGS